MPDPEPGKDLEKEPSRIVRPEEATLIGPELMLTGELVSEENIYLRGRVEGNISTSGSLFVEPTGHVKGDITAENVVVEGSVEGTVIAAMKFDFVPPAASRATSGPRWWPSPRTPSFVVVSWPRNVFPRKPPPLRGVASNGSEGELNRRVIVVLGMMIVLVVLLVTFTVTHQRPLVPGDLVHLKSAEIEYCLSCHGRGRPNARPKNHPLNDHCWECHERAH